MFGVTARAAVLIAIIFVSQSQCQNDDLNVDEAGSGDFEPLSVGVPPEIEVEEATTQTPQATCPSSCLCSQVGKTITIDCSGLGLAEVPANLLAEVTELILHNNDIEKVPAFISKLTSLESLDLSNNAITELEFGSVSELSKLRKLNLANNKLDAYPQELRNAMDLVNLIELDISGNELAGQTIASHDFSLLENLKVLILPAATEELKAELCIAQGKLERVCEATCSDGSHVCSSVGPASVEAEPPATEAPVATTADGASTPGTIVVQESPIAFAKASADGDASPQIVAQSTATPDVSPSSETAIVAGPGRSVAAPEDMQVAADKPVLLKEDQGNLVSSPAVKRVDHNQIAIGPSSDDGEDKVVEPKTAEVNNSTKGGVSNTVIGLVIGVMVVLVAGVTIKRNWKSIKNRCGGESSERPATDVTRNGTAAEEIPLQDKSPA